VSFPFALRTPERTLFEGEVDEVSLRAAGGDIAFLTGHVPFIGAVQVSECRIAPTGAPTVYAAVHGGLVEVDPERAVVLLAPVAELASEIDVGRARAAEARLAGSAHVEDARAAAALERAVTRLAVAGAGAGAAVGAGAPVTGAPRSAASASAGSDGS